MITEDGILINGHSFSHVTSHNKIFYWLNVSELSTSKSVTANDLETSYILFLSQPAIYKERLNLGQRYDIFLNVP